MSEREPTATVNLDIYGNGPLEWERARRALATELGKAETPMFFGTVRPDGRPHSAGAGLAYHDGDIYLVSGPGTRKSRNLAADPRATVSVRLPGIDLVLEGAAVRVTDDATLQTLAALYRDSGWPARVEGDAFTAPFSAPSAGPPPWWLYRFTFDTVVGVASAEPPGATKWRFA